MANMFVGLLLLGILLVVEPSEFFYPGLQGRHLHIQAEKAEEQVSQQVAEGIVTNEGSASLLQQMVSLADNPGVVRLAQLYKENKHFIHHCDFTSELHGLPSCINVTGDIANLTVVAIYGYQLAHDLGGAIVDLLNELNMCSTESWFDQLKCYKKAFQDIQSDIKEYSSDFNNFLSNATVVLNSIKFDVKQCFSVSEKFSAEWVESKIELCKDNLISQQLL